jgi:hypothetical protein
MTKADLTSCEREPSTARGEIRRNWTAAQRTIELPATLLQPIASATLDAWRPQEALHEDTSARDRAAGFVLRMAPLSAIWLILSIAVAIVLAMLAGGLWATVGGLVLWGSLTALTYLAHDRQERQFAAGGIERHRLDLAADIELKRMENEHELRKAVIGAHIKQLEVRRD